MIPSLLLEVVHVTHEISLTLHDSIVYPYLNTKSLVTSNTFQSFTMLSIPDIANMTKATSGTASMIPPHGTDLCFLVLDGSKFCVSRTKNGEEKM
jgi:hypothetical protein